MCSQAEVYLDIEDPFQTEGVFLFSRLEAEEDNLKLKAFVLVLIMTAFAVPPALAAAPSQENVSFPAMPPQAGVEYAVASLYAPMGEAAFWSSAICSQMTAGGCDYFQREQADVLWQSAQGARGDTAKRAEVVAEIPPKSQLWKMSVTVWNQKGSSAHDVYVLVSYSDDQSQWLLDRVLYGPHLGFSK
jgi:hypothetical protein